MSWHTGGSDLFFCLLPIAALVAASALTTWDTGRTLPATALGMFCVRTMYLATDPLVTLAAVISGMHEALVPLSIIFGAVSLFRVMGVTGCMDYMIGRMVAVTGGNRVAQLMILGWSFMTLLEGCSGFGTPLVAVVPILVKLGHEKISAIMFLLMTNALVTAFGAAGTPLWYGLSAVGVEDPVLVQTGFLASIALGVLSLLVLPVACMICTTRAETMAALRFIWLSALAGAVPSVMTAYFSYTFPAIVGGAVGCAITFALVKRGVGITSKHPVLGRETVNETGADVEDDRRLTTKPADGSGSGGGGIEAVTGKDVEEERRTTRMLTDGTDEHDHCPRTKLTNGSGSGGGGIEAVTGKDVEEERRTTRMLTDGTDEYDHCPRTKLTNGSGSGGGSGDGSGGWRRDVQMTAPIMCTIALLLLTRIPQIGLKDLLTRTTPALRFGLGTYGDVSFSASFVFQLTNILTVPEVKFKFQLLYVPFILPFLVVGAATLAAFRRPMKEWREVAAASAHQLAHPAFTLLGALVLTELLIVGGVESPASIIGQTLSSATGKGWLVVAPYLGSLGSFLAGSSTVSNLTFGPIQYAAAVNVSLGITTTLALQSVGASLGTAICIFHIVAAAAAIDEVVSVKQFMKKLGPLVFFANLIAVGIAAGVGAAL